MFDSIGQLFISGIEGKVLNLEEKQFLKDENIGGVILFTRNFENPIQLAELVNSIQELRSEYPLFIAVDHEGGRVIRFKKYFTQFPSMREITLRNSPKYCFEVHKTMAFELRACGINLNFSPVCDIFTNKDNQVIGDRSFGEDEETVSKYVSAAIRGLQANGVLGCAKHFPGHGSTLKDSHFDLPVVKTFLEDLKRFEFIPFMRASKSRVEFMMMGHLLVDSIDPKWPCTLSSHAYDLIRDELKFQKIIISDDMEMKALTDNYTIEKAAVMALQAGCDMIMYQNMSSARNALLAVKESCKIKELKKEDIIHKVDRVIDCKKRNLGGYSPVSIPDLKNIFK